MTPNQQNNLQETERSLVLPQPVRVCVVATACWWFAELIRNSASIPQERWLFQFLLF